MNPIAKAFLLILFLLIVGAIINYIGADLNGASGWSGVGGWFACFLAFVIPVTLIGIFIEAINRRNRYQHLHNMQEWREAEYSHNKQIADRRDDYRESIGAETPRKQRRDHPEKWHHDREKGFMWDDKY